MGKIAFIIQRYGADVLGGSESYCRQIATRLSEFYDVEVLTTKAREYSTWENVYEADEEIIDGLLVRRFASDRERCLTDQLTGDAFTPGASAEKGMEWVEAQGPYCPALVEYAEQHEAEYDAFILVTYLYYPAVAASLKLGRKSVLIPTAHDEPFIYQDIYTQMFGSVAAWYFLTPEEKAFVEGRFNPEGKILGTGFGGVGVDVSEFSGADVFRRKYGLENTPYLVYAGRIDKMKGCRDLFSYFVAWKMRHRHDNLKLVLMGSEKMDVPDHPDIMSLGFMSEDDKFSGMDGALALVMPSYFESLSIVLLEAMHVGTPVLANEKCEVLKGHCIRSGAGLYYGQYLEFEQELEYLIDHPDVREQMSLAGPEYVAKNYNWDFILQGLRDVIDATIEKSRR